MGLDSYKKTNSSKNNNAVRMDQMAEYAITNNDSVGSAQFIKDNSESNSPQGAFWPNLT